MSIRCAAPLLALLWLVQSLAPASAAEPIRLHPDNPHYFLFRGKPAVLITSTEHYGAVLNGDFDFMPYLDELHAHGFNLTRTFSGTYREDPSSFNIEHNPLSPSLEKFICPFARTNVAGAADGGNKFDLTRWNDAYFARLKRFVEEAGKRDVVIELSLFCAIYDDRLWELCPLNPANMVNDVEPVTRKTVYTTNYPKHLALQEAFVRKVVGELKDADNVYFEICNEPYFGEVSKEWNDRIAEVIREVEQDPAHRHLIAQNIANGSAKVSAPNKLVSILNFHYAKPPKSVAENYELRRPIADDETGFAGIEDLAYRREAWDFLIAGGSVFDNLDYSFTPDRPDGTYGHHKSPGSGGRILRKQLGRLKQFVESFDFTKMQPADDALRGIPKNATAHMLAEPGRQYAVYLSGGQQADLRIDLPAGDYTVEWFHPDSGKEKDAETVHHTGGERTFTAPKYKDDIALAIRKK